MRRSPSTCSLYVSFRWYLFGYGFSRLYADYLLTDWLTDWLSNRFTFAMAIEPRFGARVTFLAPAAYQTSQSCVDQFLPFGGLLPLALIIISIWPGCFFFFSVLGILSSSQWRSLAWLNFVSANLFAKLHWFMTICLARFVFAFVFVLFRALPFYW